MRDTWVQGMLLVTHWLPWENWISLPLRTQNMIAPRAAASGEARWDFLPTNSPISLCPNNIPLNYEFTVLALLYSSCGQCTTKILDLIDCTMRVIKVCSNSRWYIRVLARTWPANWNSCAWKQNEEHALYLALNDDTNFSSDDDPMLLVQSLRIHLYNGCFVLANNMEILERVKLVDLIHEFIHSYRVLLKLASTPLPWPFLQMGRTFLFIWTFSMPLVLRSPFGDASAAMVFLFFLTYGFIGLELVAMKMMSPFGTWRGAARCLFNKLANSYVGLAAGDGVHDLNITGMREVR